MFLLSFLSLSLSGSDGGCVMFWLFLMLVFSDAVKQRMHYSNLYLLQVAMATFTLLFALWSAFVPRYEEARRRIIKRWVGHRQEIGWSLRGMLITSSDETSGGGFTNVSRPLQDILEICVLPKLCFLWEFQAENLYVHPYKVSAWNSYGKCDFQHCVFLWDYFGELTKR